jgi:hypothetical protein
MMKLRTGFLLAAAACLLAGGCATRRAGTGPAAPLRETTLMVTRANGVVKLGWDSEPGRYYTVLHSRSLGPAGRWEVLPQAANLRGDGRPMSCTDSVSQDEQRFYRLHASAQPIEGGGVAVSPSR